MAINEQWSEYRDIKFLKSEKPTYYVDPISHVLIISILPSAIAAFICHKLNAPFSTGIGIPSVFYGLYAFIGSLIDGSHEARAAGVFLLLVGALVIGIHYLNKMRRG